MNPNDSLGRTAMIAVVAGVLFAGFVALTPRLTASQQAGVVDPARVQIGVGSPGTEPVVVVPDTQFDGFDAPPPPVEERHEPTPEPVECPEPEPCRCECPESKEHDSKDDRHHDKDHDNDHDDKHHGDKHKDHDDDHDSYWHDDDTPGLRDGSLRIFVELVGPRSGKESAILSEGDVATWHFWVTNNGDDELWGVYLYLEGHGPVDCNAHGLEPGDGTHCTAHEKVWEGDHTAEVWATAWTTEIKVGAKTHYDYWVAD